MIIQGAWMLSARRILIYGVVLPLFLTASPSFVVSQQNSPVVSNVFFQTEISDAIQQISLQSGINIVSSQNVRGFVNVAIQDKTVLEAIDLILAGTSYTYRDFGNYIFVFDPILDNSATLDVTDGRVFIPEFLTPIELYDLLPNSYKEFVTISSSSDLIYMRAEPEILEALSLLLSNLDSSIELEYQLIQLDNLSANDIGNLLPVSLRQNVTLDTNRNAILIFGNAARLNRIESIIRILDKPLDPQYQRDDYVEKFINLNNITTTQALSLVPAEFSDFVQGDSESGNVTVWAPSEIALLLEKIMANADRPVNQIELTARIVALNQSNTLQLGNQFDWPELTAGTTVLDGSVSESGLNFAPWELRVGYTPARSFTNALAVNLSLLAQNNQATILATPQVVTGDGSAAEIRVTTAEYYQLAIEKDGFFTADLEQIETGTILNVTPEVGENDRIRLNLNVEVSDVVSRGEDNLPTVVSRSASSVVELENGGTAAIAGLVDTRSSDSNRGIPNMRKLPFIGNVFSETSFSHDIKQVAIFLTARIIGNNIDAFEQPMDVESLQLDDSKFLLELEGLLGLEQVYR